MYSGREYYRQKWSRYLGELRPIHDIYINWIPPTPTPTVTSTPTPTPSVTPTQTSTQTPSVTPTQTQTQTPSQTATQTATPTVTPTITSTPTATPCILDCCLESSSGYLSGGTSTITEIKSAGNELYVNGGAATWGGVSLVGGAFMDYCGGVSATAITYSCLGSLTNSQGLTLMEQQSDGKFVVGRLGRQLDRYTTGYVTDTTFNTSRLPISATTATTLGFKGIYINSSDEIFLLGPLPQWQNCVSGQTTPFMLNDGIIKLLPNGDIDTSFSGITISWGAPLYPESKVTDNKDPNGKVLVIGTNSYTGDTTYRGVWRMNTNGTPDPTFSTALWTLINLAQLSCSYCLSDGKYLVGGAFTNLSGITTQDYLVRLNSDGTLDTTFQFNGNHEVNDISVNLYGEIFVVGLNKISKLSSTGSVLITETVSNRTGFNLAAVECIGCSVYVGGNYTYTSGNTYNSLTKWDKDLNLNMCPYPTPTPTVTSTITPSPTGTPSVTPTQTATQTNTPSNTSTQTVTPTNTETMTPTPSLTPTLPDITPSNTATNTQTPSPTNTETMTPTPSITASNTPTPSVTQTQTATPTNTVTPTSTNPTPPYSMTAWINPDQTGGCGSSGSGSQTLYTYFTPSQFVNGETYYNSNGTVFVGDSTTLYGDVLSCIYGTIDADGFFTQVGTCSNCL